MSTRPPFDPDRFALVTLALVTVLFWSLPLFASEVPTVDAEVKAINGGDAETRPVGETDAPTVAEGDATSSMPKEGTAEDTAPRLSIRLHTSTAMPSDALAALLDDIDRWQAVLPVSIVVRGLPVRRTANGMAATDHDRAMPFVGPLAQRNIAINVDPTVGRSLDRAYRAAFPDEASDSTEDVMLPAVEVRLNDVPLETHVGTVNFLAVLSRIARPTDDDPDAKAHAESLARALADPSLALLKARVLETAL